MEEKSTKFIILCDVNILVSGASKIVEILSKYYHEKFDNLIDKNVPIVDVRVYDSEEDFTNDGGILNTSGIYRNLLSDHSKDNWRIALIRDKEFKNVVLFSYSSQCGVFYYYQYNMDNLTEDDIFYMLKRFVDRYVAMKNKDIKYNINKTNLKKTSEDMYNILVASGK